MIATAIIPNTHPTLTSINTSKPWESLYNELEDVFQKPGALVDRPIEHRIDLLDKAKQSSKPCLYQMSKKELVEVKC